jgi:diguanylate cyclase (GGDEF)-like protein
MVDIDDFKSFGDRVGQDAGDSALQAVAERLKSMLRTVDTVARFGGDEFVLVLPEADAAEAVQVGERIVQSLIAEPPSTLAPLTASCGVVTFDQTVHRANEQEFMKRVDEALREAKRRGKTTVVHADELTAKPELD